LKGTGFSPYVNKSKIALKGTGFSPYVNKSKIARALAPEGMRASN